MSQRRQHLSNATSPHARGDHDRVGVGFVTLRLALGCAISHAKYAGEVIDRSGEAHRRRSNQVDGEAAGGGEGFVNRYRPLLRSAPLTRRSLIIVSRPSGLATAPAVAAP
jgi:hypothetical protein